MNYEINEKFKNNKELIYNINRKNRSYAVFNYLKNAKEVSEDIADYFLKNNYES